MPWQIRDADESDASALGRFIVQQCARPESHCIASWAGESEAATTAELRSKIGTNLRYCIAFDDAELVGALGCSVDDEHGTGWLRGPLVAIRGGESEQLSCADEMWRHLLRRIPTSLERYTAYLDRENEFATQFWHRAGLESAEASFVFEWRPTKGAAPPAPALRLSPLTPQQENKFGELYRSLFPMSWPGPEQILENRKNFTCLVASDAARELAGFVVIGLEGDGEGRVYTLGVSPKRRRQGYGRQLLVGALAKLVEQGAQRVVLSVNDVNARARSLYEAVGFTQAYSGVALRGTASTINACATAQQK